MGTADEPLFRAQFFALGERSPRRISLRALDFGIGAMNMAGELADLFIICNPVDGAFLPVGASNGFFRCDQISGPSPVNLAVPNLQVGGVNFLLDFVPQPR